MKNPPSGVKLVMAAVCVMKDIKPEKIADPSGTGGKVKWQTIVSSKSVIHVLLNSEYLFNKQDHLRSAKVGKYLQPPSIILLKTSRIPNFLSFVMCKENTFNLLDWYIDNR